MKKGQWIERGIGCIRKGGGHASGTRREIWEKKVRTESTGVGETKVQKESRKKAEENMTAMGKGNNGRGIPEKGCERTDEER